MGRRGNRGARGPRVLQRVLSDCKRICPDWLSVSAAGVRDRSPMVFLPEPGCLRPPPVRASPALASRVLWLSQRPSLVVSSRMVSLPGSGWSPSAATRSLGAAALLPELLGAAGSHGHGACLASTGTEVQMKRVGPKSWAPLPKKQRASSARVRAARPAGMAAGAGTRRSGPGSARLGSAGAPRAARALGAALLAAPPRSRTAALSGPHCRLRCGARAFMPHHGRASALASTGEESV